MADNISPITHLEKVIAGEESPISHLEKVIAQYSASKTDELVKMDSTTDAKYLSELIDKNTVVNDNEVLKVKKLDGQEVTIAEINHLKGLTMNIVDLVKSFANGGVKMYEHTIPTYADLLALDRSEFIDGVRYFVYVIADETHGGIKTTYICDKENTNYFCVSGDHRDFTTEPIDLANEVTGKLGTSNIDVDALWLLLAINDTYKTLTSKNEVFGTHGAKNLYDELVASISNKIDKTDITTTIGPMSTHSQVPSAKTMYDTLKITLIGSKQLDAYGKEIVKYPLGRWGTSGMGVKNLTDLPNDGVKYVEILGTSDSATPWTVGLSTRTYRATTEDGAIFTRSITSGEQGGVIEKDTGWQKVFGTSVVDVKPINITSKVSNATVNSNGGVYYSVKNGICYVQFASVTTRTSSNGQYIIPKGTLPSIDNSLSSGRYPVAGGGSTIGMVAVDGNTGGIKYFGGEMNIFTTISYPVSES